VHLFLGTAGLRINILLQILDIDMDAFPTNINTEPIAEKEPWIER
jgi:hypothetical protein